MIYETPNSTDPICQGDIFINMPRIDLNLENLPVYHNETDIIHNDWIDIVRENGSEIVTSLASIRPVIAIVINQNCDAVRNDDIALCEILPFEKLEQNITTAKYPQKTWGVITKNSRVNLKWFYLPLFEEIGFHERKAVDFRSILLCWFSVKWKNDNRVIVH